MKKDLIFAPIMLLIGVLLFLLRATGMTAHIVISVIGVLALIAYTVLTKKEWKIPALEILMRAFYGVALITGIVIMNVSGIAALAIVHKAFAALFVILLVVLFNQLVLGLCMNTLWISILYSSPFVPLMASRVVQCAVLGPVQFITVKVMCRFLQRYQKKFS